MYSNGEIVYLKTDKDQREWLIVGIMHTIAETREYRVVSGDTVYYAYEQELSRDKDVLMRVS